jgi:hypothetical protein
MLIAQADRCISYFAYCRTNTVIRIPSVLLLIFVLLLLLFELIHPRLVLWRHRGRKRKMLPVFDLYHVN